MHHGILFDRRLDKNENSKHLQNFRSPTRSVTSATLQSHPAVR